MVRQDVRTAGLGGRRTRGHGDRQPVLQLRVYDRQCCHAEPGGRRQWIRFAQAVRVRVSNWTGGSHDGIDRQRPERVSNRRTARLRYCGESELEKRFSE